MHVFNEGDDMVFGGDNYCHFYRKYNISLLLVALVRFVTLSWTLGKIAVIIGHPANGNPVLRLLTLVFMKIENRH